MYLILLFLTITLCSQTTNNKNSSSERESRVLNTPFISKRPYNDTKITPCTAAYMASVQKLYEEAKKPYQHRDFYHLCSATIVSRDFLLTAAHCVTIHLTTVTYDVHFLVAYAGINDLNNKSMGQRVQIQSVNIHPHYGGNYNSTANIALLELAEYFEFKFDVQYVELPFVNEYTRPHRPIWLDEEYNETCAITGWAAHEHNGAINGKLNQVETNIISNEQCGRLVLNDILITPHHICTHYKQHGLVTCIGDDGAALMCDGVLAGIAYMSPSEECVIKNRPEVFTRVSHYVSWIDKFTNITYYHTAQQLTNLANVVYPMVHLFCFSRFLSIFF